jgi:hypothetical protein
MKNVQSFSKVLALSAALLVITAVASASEITGTLSSGSGLNNTNTSTSGTLAGVVSQPTQTSGGGGGGSLGAGGNGPPVPNGSSYNFAVGGFSGSGSAYGGVNPDVITYNPSQNAYTTTTAVPSAGSPRQGSASTRVAVATSTFTSSPEEIALVDTVVDTSTPNVVVTKTTIDPGQFATVMTALGDGDVMTWLLALFALLLVVIAGGYLYDWFVQPQEFQRVQRK